MATATRYPFYKSLTFGSWQYKLWIYRVQNPAPFGTLPETVQSAVQLPDFIDFLEVGSLSGDFDLAQGTGGEKVQSISLRISDNSQNTWLRTNIFTNFAQSGTDLYSYQFELQCDDGTGTLVTKFFGEIDPRSIMFNPEYQGLIPFTTMAASASGMSQQLTSVVNLVIGQEIYFKTNADPTPRPAIITNIVGTTLTLDRTITAFSGDPVYYFVVKPVMDCMATDIQQYALQVQPFGDSRIYVTANYAPNSGQAIIGQQLPFTPTTNGYLPPSQGKPTPGLMNSFSSYKQANEALVIPETHIVPPSMVLAQSPVSVGGFNVPFNGASPTWQPTAGDDKYFAAYIDILQQITQAIADRMGWTAGIPNVDFSHLEYSLGGQNVVGSAQQYIPVATVAIGAASATQTLSNLSWTNYGTANLYFGAGHTMRTMVANTLNLNQIVLNSTITTTTGEVVYVKVSDIQGITAYTPIILEVGQFVPKEVLPALLCLHRTELLSNQTYYRVQGQINMNLFAVQDYSLANQGTAWDAFQLMKECFFHYSWLTFDNSTNTVTLNLSTPASNNLSLFGVDTNGIQHAPTHTTDLGGFKYAPMSFAARSVSVTTMNNQTEVTQAGTNALQTNPNLLSVLTPPNQPLIPTETINFAAQFTNASSDISAKLFLGTFYPPTTQPLPSQQIGVQFLSNQLTLFGIVGLGTVNSNTTGTAIAITTVGTWTQTFPTGAQVWFSKAKVYRTVTSYSGGTLHVNSSITVVAGEYVVCPDYSTDGSTGNVWCADSNANGAVTDAAISTIEGTIKVNLGVGGLLGNIDAATNYTALTHADAMVRLLYSIFCGFTLTPTGTFAVTSKPLAFVYQDILIDEFCPCYDGSLIDTRGIEFAWLQWIKLWIDPIDGEQQCLITAIDVHLVGFKRYASITAIYQPTNL